MMSTNVIDMAFISPNLAKHNIQFQIGDDLGSDHLPIEISIDTPPPKKENRNKFTNHTKYKFDQTDREVFESTLEEALGSADFSGLLSTSDLDKYANFIVTAISTAVDKAVPKAKSVRSESNPISDETIVLIKEKRRLRRHYSQNKDPAVKTWIDQLQKQVKEELKVDRESCYCAFLLRIKIIQIALLLLLVYSPAFSFMSGWTWQLRFFLESHLREFHDVKKHCISYPTKSLRRVLFIVRAGVAKNTKIQCTRMKLLIQPAILAICQKSINSF